MLKIRMQRVGRKHEPVYRLVLTESKNGQKSGKFLEILGSYDSRRGDKAEMKTERISHWMSHGVQLSPTVHNILVSRGVMTGKKINILPAKIISQAKNKKMSDEVKVDVAEDIAEEAAVTAPEAEVVAEPVVETPAEEQTDEQV